MRLSARSIKNLININNFTYGNQWIIRAGDPNALYFQLVDLNQDSIRYMAGIGSVASVVVTFPSIDDAQVINITAVQETDDKSIWKAVLASTQKPNSGNVIFTVTEGSVIRRFNVLNMISVEYPINDGNC